MNRLLRAALTGLALSTSLFAQEPLLAPLAKRITRGADEVGDRVLTMSGKLADAMMPDASESTYSRLEDESKDLAKTAAALDGHASEAAFGTDPAKAALETRFFSELRGVRVLARAIDQELAGGGFPEARQVFDQTARPALTELERRVPALSASR